jgi:hypothetical protein
VLPIDGKRMKCTVSFANASAHRGIKTVRNASASAQPQLRDGRGSSNE